MKRIKGKGIEVVVYEPVLEGEFFYNPKLIKVLNEFKKAAFFKVVVIKSLIFSKIIF
nr:hypothetical protein [Haloplasma contractile]